MPAASAAPVHAIVQLRLENPPAISSGYVFLGNGVLPIAPPLHDPRLDAVLILLPEAGTPPRPPTGSAPLLPVDVRLYGARVIPEVILVSEPGTQVVFRNDDPHPVTLHCSQAPALLPSGPLPPGTRLAVVPTQLGELELSSPEYPHLGATLLLTRGFASRLEWSPLGEVGVARFELPEGVYRARLFFQRRYVLEQSVVVGPAGAEFVLRPSASLPAGQKPPPSPPPLSPPGSLRGLP